MVSFCLLMVSILIYRLCLLHTYYETMILGILVFIFHLLVECSNFKIVKVYMIYFSESTELISIRNQNIQNMKGSNRNKITDNKLVVSVIVFLCL